MTRKYEKKRRAEQEEETRRRIAAVAADLHEEVGPARTTIKDIAERAGVARPTVYRYFPDDASLFRACSAHFTRSHPPPDPSAWPAIADPGVRLRQALQDMYGYYRGTEAMTANVMRDAGGMPALQTVLEEGWQPFLDAVTGILMAGWGARGARRRRLAAAIGLALDFGTWQRLARAGGLGDDEAAETMTALAYSVARR